MSGGAGVVVTGLGAVTPLGDDPGTLWRSLVAGRTAARPWDDLQREGFPVTIACRIADTLPGDHRRGANMALIAARAALRQAGVAAGEQLGVFVGTSLGEADLYEEAYPRPPGPEVLTVFADVLRRELNLGGPVRTYSSACAAGNYAIGAAAQAIRSGRADAALAGGVDPFSRVAMAGFTRLRAMAPDLCRPFGKGRRGMQIGEGAAFLVLERESSAAARGASPLARIGALGLSCDGHHPTRPRPDGAGMATAMEEALAASGLAPQAVGWVSTHGSGTLPSDQAEARAIVRVFGRRPPPCSGLKGALGHSLGAASAVEALICVLALARGELPPTANVVERDPECGIDLVLEPRRAAALDWTMNCGHGFGGLNSALLIGRA